MLLVSRSASKVSSGRFVHEQLIREVISAAQDVSDAAKAQAKGNDCGLLEDPHTAGPTLPNQDRRDELRLALSHSLPHIIAEEPLVQAVILGMANMTDGLPFPLKAVPQTVLQIIRHVESGQAAAARITELLLEVQSQWNIVAEWNGPGVSSDKIRSHIEAFFGYVCIHHARYVPLNPAAQASVSHFHSPPHTSVHASHQGHNSSGELQQRSTGGVSEDCWVDRKLKLALMLSHSNAIERVEEQMTTLAMAANGVTNQAKGTSTIDLTISQLPPPPPHVFHGREDVIISMVDMILLYMLKLLAANIAILGADIFSLRSIPNRHLAHHRPRQLFSVGETNDVLQDIVHMASQSSSILVLDNFETVWLMQDGKVRTQAELVLRHLGAIKTLTLVLTASLEPFSPSAAAQTFDEISGDMHRDIETERSAVEELVRAVDCMPLAITLLAELAQRGNKPSELLSHWRESHTAMLQTSATGRESMWRLGGAFNQTCHVKFSGRRTIATPRHLRTPSSRLASASFWTFQVILSGSCPRPSQAVGPCSHFGRSCWRAANAQPHPHYILSTYSMTPQNFSAMRYIYIELAFSAPREPCEEFATESAAIVPEYENLTGFLLHLIRAEDPSQDLFDAVAAVSEYSYWTIPATTLREAFQSRLHDHPIWLAECSTDLGRMYLAKSQYDAALDILEQAFTNGISPVIHECCLLHISHRNVPATARLV
ncbi:hypothetical protein BKA62DRAFT_822094 [Auriculariales sp. MPI-PUGE-AT-0066]|nr:hypothetical protein BKA62DRAFT_822094 [Auriculariales sp. MPI-PUGE-AT-0066]